MVFFLQAAFSSPVDLRFLRVLVASVAGAASQHVGVLDPQLTGQPDGQGHGVGTLDVKSLDVPPALDDELLSHTVDNGCDVLGQLLGGELGRADADGSGGRGGKLDGSAV